MIMIDSSSIKQEDIVRIFVGSLQEIMGENDLQPILHIAGLRTSSVRDTLNSPEPFNAEDFTAGWQALVNKYGLRGAEGVILRSGQVFFKDFLRRHGFETGLMEREFRSLPKPRRIRKGLGMLAALQEAFIPGTATTIIEEHENWLWETERCEWCGQHKDNRDALSKFTIGIIQEFLFWTSGGKCYPVHEADDLETSQTLFAIRVHKEYID
jgi:hypothetical protein